MNVAARSDYCYRMAIARVNNCLFSKSDQVQIRLFRSVRRIAIRSDTSNA